LKKDQAISIATSGDGSVMFVFKYVKNDSRCPINANYVTAGTAIVVVTMNGGSETEFEMNKPKQIAEYRGQKLFVELIELLPYPELRKEPPAPSEYTAKFKIFTQS
jgi:hypothetical protein